MKRIVLFGFLALCAAGFVSAQTSPRGPHRGMDRRALPSRQVPQAAAEQVTVSGELSVVHGMIALVSGDTVYYAGGLNRFTGFIEGLKEGARVSLEGSAYQLSNDAKAKFLRVSKLTLNGKDYDLSPLAEAFAPRGFPLPHGRYNYGRGGYR